MAGRPKGKTKTTVKKPAQKLTCASCGDLKNATEYYTSTNPIHKTGKIPYCKECLRDMIRNSDGYIDLDKLKATLKMIDRPFLYELWKSSLNEGGETFGIYMKNSMMTQYRYLTWKDSLMNPEDPVNMKNEMSEVKSDFKVTQEMIDFFGIGYEDEEYKIMFDKYNFLKNNYPEKTNMHIEALKTYVRYKVKEELATASGDVGAAKAWGELSNKAATNAKINPSQLTKADLSDGLSTFSELSQAVERECDIIPILPKFKYRPNDALDFNIWCYINYMRDLSGLPPCSYEDVYKFYDRRKQDYIEQYGDPYGIFEDDPAERNRENIKKFLKEDGE